MLAKLALWTLRDDRVISQWSVMYSAHLRTGCFTRLTFLGVGCLPTVKVLCSTTKRLEDAVRTLAMSTVINTTNRRLR